MISVTVNSCGTDELPPVETEELAVTGEEPLGTADVPSGRVTIAVEVSAAGEVAVTEEV